jgi:hypothetical protein
MKLSSEREQKIRQWARIAMTSAPEKEKAPAATEAIKRDKQTCDPFSQDHLYPFILN